MTELDLITYFKENCSKYYKYIVEEYELLSEEKLENILKEGEELYKNSDNIAPKKELVFKALEKTEFENVRVVILAQDPYPDIDIATGLAFDFKGEETPKSLKNIIEEVYKSDAEDNKVVDLESWAKQGVLLLNTYLTVGINKKTKKIKKHKSWQELTDAIIKAIDKRSKEKREKVVFMLWGVDSCITGLKILFPIYNDCRMTLTATHPSDRSKAKEARYAKPFVGCDHFRKANEFLEAPIDWKV